jgi:hypothetical protein
VTSQSTVARGSISVPQGLQSSEIGHPCLLFSMTTVDLSRQGSRVGIGRVPRQMEVMRTVPIFVPTLIQN